LQLDRVWWLLTPGNPLKNHDGLHALAERADAARRTADDPRIDISCLEAVIGTRYTVDTIIHLRRRVSGVHFVWIMGADNLAQFHRWKDWRRIASDVPIAVIDRPPQSFRALAAPAAQALARYRLPENQATGWPISRPRPGLSHRHEIQSVFDRPSEPGWELEDAVKGVKGYWNVETINPTCVEWCVGAGFAPRYSERNGPWPHLYCQSLFYPRSQDCA